MPRAAGSNTNSERRNDAGRSTTHSKMSEKCDTTQNITKLSYPGDNLGFTTEIDGRENKDDYLTFPFDHMYACNSDNSDLNSERQAGECEVRQLKELLMLHLDLIQHQSEEIVTKDKYIAQLRQENDMLKQRLERMERRVNLQKNNSHLHSSNNNVAIDAFSDSMTQDTGFCADADESKEKLKAMGLCGEQPDCEALLTAAGRRSADRDSGGEAAGRADAAATVTDPACTADLKIKSELSETESCKLSESNDAFPDSTTVAPELAAAGEPRPFGLRLNSRRKRLCSNSSQFSAGEEPAAGKRKKRKGLPKRAAILTTAQPYVTAAGDAVAAREDGGRLLAAAAGTLEVPRWRVKLYTSCYSMEGTENLDDEVYNKRHLRLENDERRRKRWDVQRIREQRHIERLKQRQERINAGRADEPDAEPPASFWPSLDDVRYLEVADELPVAAFGTPIPKLAPSEFSLPWLNGAEPARKPQTRKSTARRRQHKR